MLTDQDELGHRPEGVANWQENYVWHAWSPAARSGWNLHLGDISEKGILDLRAHVVIDGVVTACGTQEEGNGVLAQKGLEVDIDVPFGSMRLRYEGHGQRGPDTGGWYGRRGGDVPFGFDVRVETVAAPFDSLAHPIVCDSVDIAGNHYELGGRWSGRLWSGDDHVEVSGLVIRDHSWGGRAWPWDSLFWVPMVLDEGRRFAFSWTERIDGHWRGTSVMLDENGVVDVAPDVWVRLGEAVPYRSHTAPMLRLFDDRHETYTLTGGIHIPAGRERSRVGLSDMWSTVRGPQGEGFATIQIFPTEDEVAGGFADPLPQFRPIPRST